MRISKRLLPDGALVPLLSYVAVELEGSIQGPDVVGKQAGVSAEEPKSLGGDLEACQPFRRAFRYGLYQVAVRAVNRVRV